MKFALELSYPHSWASDVVLHFSTIEEAREYGNKNVSGRPGFEGYCRVRIYQLVEELN